MTRRLPSESDLIPYTPGFPPGGRWLVLAPHADDEVLGPGATLAMARRRGVEIVVAIVTDGAQQGAAPVREAEATAAAAALGTYPPEFWRLGDRTLAASATALEQALTACLLRVSPDAVLVTSPVELHPDHRALALGVQRVLRRSTLCGLRRRGPAWVVAYEVGTPLRPNLLVAADEGWEAKRRAIACYASQLAVSPYDSVMESFATLRCLTLTGCRRAEAMHVLSARDVARRSARGWAAAMGSPAGVASL